MPSAGLSARCCFQAPSRPGKGWPKAGVRSMLRLLVIALSLAVLLAVSAVLAITAVSAYRVVRPRRSWSPPDWQPPQVGEPVAFRNPARQRLAGWFVSPQPGKAVAIVCHGFGTN